MGKSYTIPREVKGENRILYVLTLKSTATTILGLIVGVFIYKIMSLVNLKLAGTIILVIITLLGFAVGAVKLPDSNSIEMLKKAGGEELGTIILRLVRFYKNRKIYLYDRRNKQ